MDFDDAAWPSSPLPIYGSPGEETVYGLPGASPSVGLITMRAVFVVTAPAEVKHLHLTMSYLGGAVVYLNGKEVARADMPPGDILPATPAGLYPSEVWVDSTGVAMPSLVVRNAAQKELVTKRERHSGPGEHRYGQ